MSDEKHSTSALVVAGITVYQDAYGRYNINALHQASAAGEAKSPNRWARLKTTKALQAELETQVPYLALDIVHGGERSGTYAHELLAVEYAGWISPAFRLKVNQAFIDVRLGRYELTLPPRPARRIEISLHLAKAWRLLRTSDEWLSNHEIAQRTGIAPRTVRSYTHYLGHYGLLDCQEVFPRHLYRLAPEAARQQARMWQHLDVCTELLLSRIAY